MEDKLLQEYVATANNPKYKSDWDVINSKFPELANYDKKVLQEYVATANNPEYKSDWATINSKFPELKKEQVGSTVSPLESAQPNSDLGSQSTEIKPISDVSQEELSVENLPFRTADESVAALYDEYKEAGVIKPKQVEDIESVLEAQKNGDRTLWEKASAYTDGLLKVGTMIPLYQFDTKEDLVKSRESKNRIDFLRDLPENKVSELNEYAVNRSIALDKESVNIMAEMDILEEKGLSLVGKLKQAEKAIKEIVDSGKEVPQEAQDYYTELFEGVNEIQSQYNKNIDIVESKTEDIGNFAEELDFLKKNYGGLDYYQDVSRLATADMLAGVMQFGLSTAEMAQSGFASGIGAAPIDPKAQGFIQEFKEEIDNQRELLKPSLSVSEIDNIGDFSTWLGEQVATQLPVLTVMMASGGTGVGKATGLSALSASSGGSKMNELIKEGGYTKGEIYLSGVAAFVAEYATESVSLGILSKGKRTIEAAKRAGLEKELKIGFANSLKATGRVIGEGVKGGVKEGGAEFLNQMSQNLVDIMYLGKEDTHVLDGTVDALASGGVMGVGMSVSPTLVGMGLKAITKHSTREKLGHNAQKIEDLQSELNINRENLSEDVIKQIEGRIEELTSNNVKIMEKAYGDLSNLEKAEIQELIDLDKNVISLKKKAKEINNTDLSPETKESLINDFRVSVEKSKNRKEGLLEKAHGSKQGVQQEGTVVEEATAETTTKPIKEETVNKGTEGSNKVQGEVSEKPSSVGDGKGVQPNSVGDTGKTQPVEDADNQTVTNAENRSDEVDLGKLPDMDLSEPTVMDKVIKALDSADKALEDFGKETLGVALPVVVARGAIKAMKVAAKSVKTGAELVEAGIEYLKTTDWYMEQSLGDKKNIRENLVKKLSEVGKLKEVENVIVSPNKKKGAKGSVKAKTRKVTGQTDTSKKVVTTERKALRDKLKTEATAAYKGYKKGRKSLADVRQKLKQVVISNVKGDVKKGDLKSMLSRINSVTEETFLDIREEVLDYIENKIDTRDRVSRINKLKGKMSSMAKKSSKLPLAVKDLAAKARLIDPKNLSKESQIEYEKVLTDIASASAPVTKDKYSMVKVDSAFEDIKKLYEESEAGRARKLVEQLGLVGTGTKVSKWIKGLTPKGLKELEELLKSEEDIDETITKEEKRKKVREALETIAEVRVRALAFLDTSKLSKKHKEYVNILKKADVSKLSLNSLKELIKVVDNAIVNEDFSSAYNVISKVKVSGRIAEFIGKLSNKGKRVIARVRDNEFTEAKDVSLVLKEMFGGTVLAAEFNKLSGLFDSSFAYEQAKRASRKLEKEYTKFMKPLLKKNSKLRNVENIITRSVVGNLIQGTTVEDFEINKSRVEKTIENLKSSEKTKGQGKKLEEIYEEYKNSKNQDEVLEHIKSKKDGNYEVLDFWIKKFGEISDSLETNTREVFGESFNQIVGNYLPIGTSKTVQVNEMDDILRPSFLGTSPSPKKSPTTMNRAKTKRLPSDYRLNLDFDSVMFDKFGKSTYDIMATEAAFDLVNFFKNKETKELLGVDNARVMAETINRLARVQRGLTQYDSTKIGKTISRAALEVKKIAAIQALGAITAYPKQFFGVIQNAIFRLGIKDVDLMFGSMMDLRGTRKIELVEQFLSARGDLQGGVIQSYQNMSIAERNSMNALAETIASETGQKIRDVQNALFYSLRKGDTDAAKATWLAYYKKYLRKRGVDITKIDWSTEHEKLGSDELKRSAASYAQQNVEETQIATDESRESLLYSKEAKEHVKIFKDILLPYSRFVIQAKMRMIIDGSNLIRATRTGDKQGAKDALSSLAGSFAEQVTFHGINYFILKPILFSGVAVLRDLLGFDDEEEKYDWDFKWTQMKSKLAGDMNPFVLGSFMENAQIEALNWIAYVTDKDASEFDNQEDFESSLFDYDEKKKWYRYGDKAGFDILDTNLGVYQGAFDTWAQLAETGELAFGENPEVEGFYGNKQDVYLDKKQEKFMKAMFVVEALASFGLFEAEAYRAMKKIQREQVKLAK